MKEHQKGETTGFDITVAGALWGQNWDAQKQMTQHQRPELPGIAIILHASKFQEKYKYIKQKIK